MALVEPTLTLAPDAVASAVTQPVHFPKRAAAIGAAGFVVFVAATFVFRHMDTVPRTALAAIGATGLWYGIQRVGAYLRGPNFSLGFILAVGYLGLIAFLTIFADFLPIEDYRTTVLEERRARPRLSFNEPLGRDIRGGSFLSQIIYAGRVSLTIVLLAVVVGLVVGSVLGLLGGFFKKWIEAPINIGVNTTLAFPPLVLLIAIAAVFDRTVWSIGIGLAIVSVPTYARIMRAQTITLRERDFITAARAMGATNKRIMFREILPNAMLPVLSYTFISAAVVIIAEGSLAFLGLSVKFPQPTWGFLVADGKDRLKTDPHLTFVPAAVMFLTVLSLNRVGDWSRRKALGEKNLL